MSYFILDFASASKETGTQFPQVQKMSVGYDYDTSNSIYAVGKCRFSFPDFKPNLDSFVLHPKANLTDVISISLINGAGFLISEKFKKLLQDFNIVQHKFYPASVIHEELTNSNYYWMHIINDLTDYVNYKRSKFFIYKNFSINAGTISIESKEHFLKRKDELKKANPKQTVTIWAETICFNSKFDTTLDFFDVSTFDAKYYISERLAESIINSKITGMKISPTNNILLDN